MVQGGTRAAQIIEAPLHFLQGSEKLLFPKLRDCATVLDPAELPVRETDAV